MGKRRSKQFSLVHGVSGLLSLAWVVKYLSLIGCKFRSTGTSSSPAHSSSVIFVFIVLSTRSQLSWFMAMNLSTLFRSVSLRLSSGCLICLRQGLNDSPTCLPEQTGFLTFRITNNRGWIRMGILREQSMLHLYWNAIEGGITKILSLVGR